MIKDYIMEKFFFLQSTFLKIFQMKLSCLITTYMLNKLIYNHLILNIIFVSYVRVLLNY